MEIIITKILLDDLKSLDLERYDSETVIKMYNRNKYVYYIINFCLYTVLAIICLTSIILYCKFCKMVDIKIGVTVGVGNLIFLLCGMKIVNKRDNDRQNKSKKLHDYMNKRRCNMLTAFILEAIEEEKSQKN